MENIQLLEDKVAKFDGQIYPKFGWCCILAGGPGSGKGYSFDHYVPIQGHKFDVDEIKSYYIKKIRIVSNELGDRLVYTDRLGDHSIDLDEVGINPPYNTNNPQFTGLLHQIAKPLTKKIKSLIFKGGGESDRLPNIIFDCTMSDVSDYELLIPTMKDLGYKIALVYVFTPIDRAIEQNRTRGTTNYTDDEGETHYGRRVDYKLLLDNHSDVYSSLHKIKNRSDLINKVDDAWAIVNYGGEIPEVIYIKRGNSLDISEIADFMRINQQDINYKIDDYAYNGDIKNYNEGLVTGAFGLYEALKDLKEID